MSRIVLFGATGYTGRLTAEAMVGRGMRPVLAGRAAGNQLGDAVPDPLILDGRSRASVVPLHRAFSPKSVLFGMSHFDGLDLS